MSVSVSVSVFGVVVIVCVGIGVGVAVGVGVCMGRAVSQDRPEGGVEGRETGSPRGGGEVASGERTQRGYTEQK